MLRRASIRTQLAMLVVAVGLPLLATVIYNHLERIKDRTALAAEFVRELAGATEVSLSRIVEEERILLAAMAARPAQRVERPDPCDPLIADFHAINPRRANIVIGALSGELICSALAQPSGPPASLLKMAHIQRLLRTGEFTIGDPFKGPIVARWIVPLSYPRRDTAGRLIGWIGLPLEPLRLEDLLKKVAQDTNHEVVLLTAQGVVLARSTDTETWVGKSLRDGPFPRALFDGSLSEWEGRGVDGVLRVWASKQVPGTDWRVLVGADKQAVLAPINAALTRNMVVIALVMLGVIAASLWIGRGIARPLIGLAETMQKIGSGVQAMRAPVWGAAEVADVAAQFNRMLDARVRDEIHLRASESRFRGIIQASPVPYALNDDRQNITYLNSAFVRTFGYDQADIPTLADWWPKAYPDAAYRQWAATTWQARLDAATQTGAKFQPVELDIRCKDGTLRTVVAAAESLGESFKGEHLVILYDISERKRAETAAHDYAERLQAVSRKLLEIQESERRLLARELHDEVGGVLTAVKLNLQSLRRQGASAAGEAALADGLALVDGAIQSVRSLSLDLRPAMLDDLGLIPALKWYCERQARRAGVAIEVALDPVDLKTTPQLESACFRIVQESVNNALRHADARRIQVALRRDGGIVIEIADDGRGFDLAAVRGDALAGSGSGVLSMHERAELLGGQLTIESAPGTGTRVRAEIPIPDGGHG
jgi:PAS domain S-box-containing protein